MTSDIRCERSREPGRPIGENGQVSRLLPRKIDPLTSRSLRMPPNNSYTINTRLKWVIQMFVGFVFSLGKIKEN